MDFAKLLSKDKVSKDDDHRMELINKGGQSFFVPVSDRETTGIYNFSKWEQAFRVFSNIYTRRYPSKATDLIQYNHVIYSASLTYVWDNVYKYDREFRMHISNYPQRSWSVILQQAWSMYLKDKISLAMMMLNHQHHTATSSKRKPVRGSTKVSVHQVETAVMITDVPMLLVANSDMEHTSVARE